MARRGYEHRESAWRDYNARKRRCGLVPVEENQSREPTVGPGARRVA
jgi:hypothetical protein